jgi:hypothetical protein
MDRAIDLVPSPSALLIAAVLQSALAVNLFGHKKIAIWVCAVAVAMFVWQWTRKRSKVLLVVLNAILLTLPPLLYFGSRGGDSAGAGAAQAETPPPPSGADRKLNDSGAAAFVADDAFPGVILFPEVLDHVTLVPPLPAMRSDIFSKSAEPLSIPFFGAYWLYKAPQRELPKTAVAMRGDPDRKTFRANDGRAMSMEAHQNLGTFIQTACCRAIEIAVRNADRYPGTLAVNLHLVNSEMPGKPAMSLGTVPVTTSSPFFGGGGRPRIAETLTFLIPSNPTLARFDEFSVKFVLDRMRKEHSAGVAIERFVLLPRVR